MTDHIPDAGKKVCELTAEELAEIRERHSNPRHCGTDNPTILSLCASHEALRSRLADAEGEQNKMRGLLSELQWPKEGGQRDDNHYCAICGWGHPKHRPSCRLAAFLAGKRGDSVFVSKEDLRWLIHMAKRGGVVNEESERLARLAETVKEG